MILPHVPWPWGHPSWFTFNCFKHGDDARCTTYCNTKLPQFEIVWHILSRFLEGNLVFFVFSLCLASLTDDFWQPTSSRWCSSTVFAKIHKIPLSARRPAISSRWNGSRSKVAISGSTAGDWCRLVYKPSIKPCVGGWFILFIPPNGECLIYLSTVCGWISQWIAWIAFEE